MKTLLYIAMFIVGFVLLAFVYTLMHNTIPTSVGLSGGATSLAAMFCVGRIIDRIEEKEND